MGDRRNGRGGQRQKGKYKSKFIGLGSILKGESSYDDKPFRYISVNVYCGKNKAGKPIQGSLILQTFENGKAAYHKIKTIKITDPTENQDSSFVVKNLSVNLLNPKNVEKMKENGGSSSSKSSARQESDDDLDDSSEELETSEESSDELDSDGGLDDSSDDSDSEEAEDGFDF